MRKAQGVIGELGNRRGRVLFTTEKEGHATYVPHPNITGKDH